MKKLILSILLILFCETVLSQNTEFLWLESNFAKTGFNFTKHKAEFVLISRVPEKSPYETLIMALPDTVPLIVFPDISYRNLLIESYKNDEFELQRRFAIENNNTLIIGINNKLNDKYGVYGFLPEDKHWTIETLSNVKEKTNLYFITSATSIAETQNFLTGLPDTLLPDNVYFLSIEKLKTKVGKTRITSVLLRNGKAVLTDISKKKISKKIIPLTKWKKQNKKVTSVKKENIRFLTETDNNLFTLTRPVSDNGVYYLTGSEGIIKSVDSTGKQLWEYDAAGTIISKPVILNDYLICSTLEGDVFILDKKDGEQLESIGIDDPIVAGPTLFTYTGDKELMFETHTGKIHAIAFATATGNIYAYTVPTFEELWINEDCKLLPDKELITVQNKIVFFDSDGTFYNIAPSTGWTIWKWKDKREPGILSSNIISNGKEIYFTLSNGNLYKIDLLIGKRIWKTKAGISSNIGFDQVRNIVVPNNRNIKIVSARSGKILKNIEVKESNFGLTSNMVLQEGNIFFGDKNGNFHKLIGEKTLKSYYTRLKAINFIKGFENNRFIVFDIYNNLKTISLNNE